MNLLYLMYLKTPQFLKTRSNPLRPCFHSNRLSLMYP
jgi:hypothetical protein